MKISAVLFSLFINFVRSKDAESKSKTSKLMVHVPHKFYKESGYAHQEALFGMPSYGGSIAQNLFYANSNLCDPTDEVDGFPKSADDDQTDDSVSPFSPFIMMVDRGGCTFVQKVRNAQHMGAAGVLIADNTCLCSDKLCMAHQKGSDPACEAMEPIMADDGSGADISIPSFLMYKVDAINLIMEVKNNRPVQVEMAWSLPSPDDRVEYDLYTTPVDQNSQEFLQSFKNLAGALRGRAYFTPHMYIHDGNKMGCTDQEDASNDCHSLCTNNGRYCATDPDGDIDKGISGADVVVESMRRLCIWNHYGAPNGFGGVWWDYVNEFANRCSAEHYFSDRDCIQDVYKAVGIDGSVVDLCMADSGGVEGDVPNSKLDMEIRAQQERGVVIMPTIYVNTAPVRGSMTSTNVFRAICSGFAGASMPDICGTCSSCDDAVNCVQHGGHCVSADAPAPGVSGHFFATSMLTVIGCFSAVGVWYYKKTQEQMREHVRGIMSEYMPLDDESAQELDLGNPMSYNLESGPHNSPPPGAFFPDQDHI